MVSFSNPYVVTTAAKSATEGSALLTDGKWVASWIAARFGDSGTAVSYRQAWHHLLEYFHEKEISSLGAITRQAVFDYFLWRTVSRNTVYGEVRVLSVVLKESVLRGLIPANPAVQLGIKKLPVQKVKPEYSAATLDELQAVIDSNKSRRREFYRVSFAVARYHGVRLAETRFPLSWVNFEANTIRFVQKGGKELIVPLHQKLRPILLELKERGQAWTFAEPSNPNLMAANWSKFLRRRGFTEKVVNACFHALRVTAISQLARANISEAKAKRFVGHSSTAVHTIYQRVQVDDLRGCCDALH